jgi:hypothetical protein
VRPRLTDKFATSVRPSWEIVVLFEKRRYVCCGVNDIKLHNEAHHGDGDVETCHLLLSSLLVSRCFFQYQ